MGSRIIDVYDSCITGLSHFEVSTQFSVYGGVNALINNMLIALNAGVLLLI